LKKTPAKTSLSTAGRIDPALTYNDPVNEYHLHACRLVEASPLPAGVVFMRYRRAEQ
jgi:hypothetical protein